MHGHLDVFQPCVTFNYLNTYDWFRKRVYKLEEEGHNYADMEIALERSFEWGDRIPIGIFYRAERPTFRDNLLQLKEATLRELPTEDIEIAPILRTMM
jgi:2-oxoglutarate ferredoxin oxidoreductase subunit beta